MHILPSQSSLLFHKFPSNILTFILHCELKFHHKNNINLTIDQYFTKHKHLLGKNLKNKFTFPFENVRSFKPSRLYCSCIYIYIDPTYFFYCLVMQKKIYFSLYYYISLRYFQNVCIFAVK